jgi:hypothetical protein
MPYHPFVTRVVPNMVMRRERMLPLRGEVLVGTGHRVHPTDVIGRTSVPSEVHLLNVARALSLASTDLGPYMRVAAGARVEEGDVLAAGSGASRLFGRSYRSPVTGVVAGVSNGRVLIQSDRQVLDLAAHYRGTVINVMSGLGAIIEVKGALIQGIWGSAKEGFGVLRVMVDDPSEAMDPAKMDMSCRNAVLVGSSSLDEETLLRARDVEVQGVIVGGVDTGLVDVVEAMPFPVVVTEGMGRFTISGPVFELLKAYDGQEASIRGTMEARGGAVRPEVIIYASYAGGDAELEGRPEFLLEAGSQVRIVRGPHMGETGTVTAFPLGSRQLATGAKAKVRGFEIRLDSGAEVFVAQTNVELFG